MEEKAAAVTDLEAKIERPMPYAHYLVNVFVPRVFSGVTSGMPVEMVARTVIDELMDVIHRPVQVAVQNNGSACLYGESQKRDAKAKEDRLLDDIADCDKTSKSGIGLDYQGERIGAVFVHDYENLGIGGRALLESVRPIIAQALCQARQHEAKIKEAETDELTNLARKKQFDIMYMHVLKELNQARERGRPHKGIAFSMVDIDDFKGVNDTYGHEQGDKTLSFFGGMLQDMVRAGDVVGRVGGEEFGVLFVDCDYDFALQRMEDIRQSVEAQTRKYYKEHMLCRPITFSAGVAFLPRDHGFGSDLKAASKILYNAADLAMYCAKKAGRNQIKGAGVIEPTF
jgi:diguanylate cyclase (GGDEF)-like protein